VVEADRFPALFVVAVAAVLAHSAFVGIVAAMATDALPGCSAKLLCRSVAVAAAEPSMRAAEGKIRCPVVEIFPVEADDIGFPAFVVSMAMFAFDGAN